MLIFIPQLFLFAVPGGFCPVQIAFDVARARLFLDHDSFWLIVRERGSSGEAVVASNIKSSFLPPRTPGGEAMTEPSSEVRSDCVGLM